MLITPDSKVKLIKNPLKLDSNNEMMFTNATAQYNYFTSLPKLEFDNLTYVRKEGVLRIPTDDTAVGTTYEDLLQYNFCMYQNTHFDNKWFYAFITDVTWVNPSMCELKLETAYFQTWQFDLVYMNSYIEREHVNDDTIGKHTLPEDVETGDYLPMDKYYVDYAVTGVDESYACFGVTEDILAGGTAVHFYGGVPNGLTYIVVKDTDLMEFIGKYDNAGKGSAINCLFVIPGSMVNQGSTFSWLTSSDSTPIHYFYPAGQGTNGLGEVTIARPSTLGISTTKYTPKNNKMLTKQFNFIIGDNLVGGTAPYYYEYFYDPTACKFRAVGTITPGCSIKVYPLAYKYTYDSGVIIDNTSYSEGLVGSKLPIGSWVSDVYTNWLTQNGVNIGLNVAQSSLKIIGDTANSNIGGATSGIFGVAGTLAQIYEHSLIPPQVEGNTNSGDITFSRYKGATAYYRMTIKEENAKIIDDFFSMFGYKVNRLGTPHLYVRTYYDYIKTIDVNIEGNVPEADLNQIRNMFNNGIRFWHDTSKYLDFSVNNTIRS